MTFAKLLLDNLWFHRRGNFAVLLGIALGAAVLTGALYVGDSLRGSLRSLALDQLGWVENALVANRFFDADLAKHLPSDRTAAALMLRGAVRIDREDAGSIGKTNVLGVGPSFWDEPPLGKEFWNGTKAEVVLNTTLAQSLGAKVGDKIVLNVQKADNVPRETLLGKRKSDDVIQGITVKVREIMPERGLGRFTLKPSPEPVRNAFVPLGFLQKALDLQGKANALLAAKATGDLAQALSKHLTLADWNLKLRTPESRAQSLVQFLDAKNKDGILKKVKWIERVPDDLAAKADKDGQLDLATITAYYRQHRPYLNLESGQLFLETPVVKAVESLAGQGGAIQLSGQEWWPQRVFIYLADGIQVGNEETPYSVIAAIDPLPGDAKSILGNDQIDLAEWTGGIKDAPNGSSVRLTYYAPDDHNQLEKKSKSLALRERFQLEGPTDDPDLTPEFPGITDKLDIRNWENPPFPYSPKRVKNADENYWKRFRATPKAYVSLATARELWGSRFGQLTSIRMQPQGVVANDNAAAMTFEKLLLEKLNPEAGGFVWQPVREQGLRAGGGSSDFGGLFLGFSFFLIAAALLLVGLLVRLNLDRRGGEIGLLLATGWPLKMVRKLLLAEGAILALVGSALGLVGAHWYADWLLRYLSENWPGDVNLNFLKLHTTPLSTAIGLVSSIVVSLGTLYWATRVIAKLAPRDLLQGQTTADAKLDGNPFWKVLAIPMFLILAAVTWSYGLITTDHMAKAGSFFGSGALVLIAFLLGVSIWLRRSGANRNPQPSVTRLGIRNAGRNAARSALTVGLLASATFLVTAVESFHKEAGEEFYRTDGGSGGFAFLAEADVPLYQDLNQLAIREELELPTDKWFESVKVYPFRVRAGDDASCLNLYQPLKPRILGVPNSLIQLGRFHFAGHQAISSEMKENPWLLLDRVNGDGTIPVFCDANTAQWILKVSLGSVIEVAGDQGQPVKLRIEGLLAESIFQSELLMSDANFRKLFPREEGFSFFLIEGARDRANAIRDAWQKTLAPHGFVVESTGKRLENFLAVENTYLATFKALGSLGLLLGAVGLAIVLLRGVWERRGELALFRALGFSRPKLAWLVLAENLLLLILGLLVGTISAFAAVAPHLIGSGAQVMWLRLGSLLGAVLAVGLVSGSLAVISTLRAPLLPALRKE